MECPVCLEPLFPENELVLPCHHILHTDCFHHLMNHGFQTCPICRYSFQPISPQGPFMVIVLLFFSSLGVFYSLCRGWISPVYIVFGSYVISQIYSLSRLEQDL